jgi:hypothetical protein
MIVVVADHAAIISGIAKEVLGSAMFGRMTSPLPKAAPTRILTTDVSIGDKSKSQRIDFVDQSISPPQIRSYFILHLVPYLGHSSDETKRIKVNIR